MNEEVESMENFMINNDRNSTIYTMPSYSYHLPFLVTHMEYIYIHTLYHTYIHKCVSFKHMSDITIIPLSHLKLSGHFKQIPNYFQ